MVLAHYRARMNSKGLTPDLDQADAKCLKDFLRRNSNLFVRAILRTLDNAFNSTSPYQKLKPGFRLAEFLAHYSKYQAGPIKAEAKLEVHRTGTLAGYVKMYYKDGSVMDVPPGEVQAEKKRGWSTTYIEPRKKIPTAIDRDWASRVERAPR
jgi:hypothetical protein